MKRALLVALVLAGCSNPAEEFRAAAPSQQAVSLTMPSNGAGASSVAAGETEQALIGQRAVFFEITRGVTTVVNGSVTATLILLETITDHHPTSLTATHATWGPYTAQLGINTWKFDVEKVGTIDYTYVLSGKPRFSDDTKYQAVITGKAHVVSRIEGSGDFAFNFTSLHQLDPAVLAQGAIAVHYDNTNNPRQVDVTFQNFDDGIGSYTPNDAIYTYVENADRSGSFSFVTKADVNHDPLRDKEDVSIVSQWLGTGQGRSDVKASGGSLSAAATLTECWNSSFARTYFTDSWNPLETEGDPASCKP
jgi:hypothetical protein